MTEQVAPDDAVEPPVTRAAEPIFNLPALVTAIILVCVLIHVVRVYLLTMQQDLEVLLMAAFIPIRYSGQFAIDIYAFTSPFTYAFLHGSFPHVVINMVWLAAFGSPLANRLGTGRFMLFWALTALAAAGLHYALHSLDHAPLVGASGAISGMMGAAARFGFRIDRSAGKPGFAGEPLSIAGVFRSRSVVTFLAIWMIVNLVTGLVGYGSRGGDSIAWEAHIGGFLAGFFGIDYLDRKAVIRRHRERPIDPGDENQG